MKSVFIGIAIGVALAVVGSMDYEDAKQQESTYCDNVRSGVWPDYEERFKKDCK